MEISSWVSKLEPATATSGNQAQSLQQKKKKKLEMDFFFSLSLSPKWYRGSAEAPGDHPRHLHGAC